MPAGGAAQGVDFALAPYSVMRMRVVDGRSGVDIAQPGIGGWGSLMGPALLRPARLDTATGDYVLYLGPLGDTVATYVPGYVSRFVAGGHCDFMTLCISLNPPLRLEPLQVRHFTFRVTPSESYIFAGDFE